MISLETNTIVRNQKSFPIIKFEVWFHLSGFGYCETLEELQTLCRSLDIPANSATAVPVAIADGTYEPIH